ncbi:MAG: FHA domain-containing protein, partial [Alphaproteobacteria bacterium]|nr:FHA domain-containing protein [Alphaproteobacteria bacterium]
EDLNSTNGVFVNGKRSLTAWLKHGDEVKFGPVVFEFILDKPVVSDTLAAPADNEDDDDDEKTMMFGSVKSSEVFLQAAKEVKEEEKEEKEETAKPKKKATVVSAISAVEGKIPTVFADKLNAKIIGGIATVAIIAIIASWYPSHLKRKEIADSIQKCTQITKKVVSSTRDRTSAQVYTADYEKDLIRLSEISAKMQRLLKNNIGNVSLSNQTAKVAFLEFERDFAKQLDNRNLHEASIITNRMIKKSEEIAKGIPENVRDDEIEIVNTVVALSKFAKILIAFRSFAQKYPMVSEITATNPDDMRFSKLQNKKADFFRYRRTYNSALSVNYLVFKKIVDDIDKRDISLFDEWTGFFINRAEPRLF